MNSRVLVQLVDGAVTAGKISEILDHCSNIAEAGAVTTFLGQVRADVIEGQNVTAIEYTAHQSMAAHSMTQICEGAVRTFDLLHCGVIHSIGKVAVGERSLFVAVVARHREASFQAIKGVVDALKKETPIWGKELLVGEGSSWKLSN